MGKCRWRMQQSTFFFGPACFLTSCWLSRRHLNRTQDHLLKWSPAQFVRGTQVHKGCVHTHQRNLTLQTSVLRSGPEISCGLTECPGNPPFISFPSINICCVWLAEYIKFKSWKPAFNLKIWGDFYSTSSCPDSVSSYNTTVTALNGWSKMMLLTCQILGHSIFFVQELAETKTELKDKLSS